MSNDNRHPEVPLLTPIAPLLVGALLLVAFILYTVSTRPSSSRDAKECATLFRMAGADSLVVLLQEHRCFRYLGVVNGDDK